MSKISCLIIDDESRAREVLDIYISDIPELQLIGHCKNAIEAINLMAEERVDLIFLDIEMPEITGLALAKTIKDKTGIIFTTAHRDYAVDAFDLKAIDYLLKPIRPERFKEAIEKFKLQRNQNQIQDTSSRADEYILIRADRKTVKLSVGAILYIESFSDYLKIHTNEGLIVTRETLSNLQERLPQNQFLRIHRSYLIHVKAVTSFTKETVEIGGAELSISRSYKAAAQKRLTN
ncbi:LytR/AlgR family response regulator transcription factor [Roseivirga sp.]|uniref:LytR/AlgR family response regulator transcription factor n=1 Tax=Roseivirga sp. TaxID=1964215 RepID=UPI003B8B40D0